MRENGYYWIKFGADKHDPVTEKGWEVAYFQRGVGWFSIWDGGAYADTEIEQIDEIELTRK